MPMTGGVLPAGGGVAHKNGVVRNNRRGQFTGTDKLTKQQADFVRCYSLNGGVGTHAAEAAGYQHPGTRAWELMQNPVIIAAIRDTQLRKLHTEGAVIGVGVLLEIARDKTQLSKDRIAAAGKLLDGARLTGQGQQVAETLTDRPLNEMTRDELARFIAAEREAIDLLEDAAQGPNVLDVTPSVVPESIQDSAETPIE